MANDLENVLTAARLVPAQAELPRELVFSVQEQQLVARELERAVPPAALPE